MTSLYPNIEPHAIGMLDVGEADSVYWEACGNPGGKPAAVLHGGPGSGCTPWHRRLFDPDAYRVVLFDQRNCGRSRPHASDHTTDLSQNTTFALIEDIETLREHLGIAEWLVMGGSWGCTLALAYAERHPQRVTEMVLFGVTAGRHSECDWLFRGGVARFFPEQWERLTAAVIDEHRGEDVVDAYHRMLESGDAEVAERAAYEWCMWESATPAWPPAPGLARRFEDPMFRMAFARIVTRYVCHNMWLDDGQLLKDIGRLTDIPAVLVNGRYDFQSPIGTAWELKHAWPDAELVIVDEAGHAADAAGITQELVRATDRFARGASKDLDNDVP